MRFVIHHRASILLHLSRRHSHFQCSFWFHLFSFSAGYSPLSDISGPLLCNGDSAVVIKISVSLFLFLIQTNYDHYCQPPKKSSVRLKGESLTTLNSGCVFGVFCPVLSIENSPFVFNFHPSGDCVFRVNDLIRRPSASARGDSTKLPWPSAANKRRRGKERKLSW